MTKYNCPSCGAPITDNKCPYCGCVIHDFATIDMTHPEWIRLKLSDGRIVVVKAYVREASLTMMNEFDAFPIRDITGRLLPMKPYGYAEIDLSLITTGLPKVVSGEQPYEEYTGDGND